MKRVASSVLGTLLCWSACHAQGVAAPQGRQGFEATPPETAAVNWQQLYEKAESSAQQWEARDKELETQIAAQMREMDSHTLEATKKEKSEPLPPAPQSPSATTHAAAATDYHFLFSNADSRGKTWRARAVVLEERYNRFQERLSAQKMRMAGTPTFAPRSPGPKGAIAHAPVPVRAKGYNRSNGAYAMPYARIAPTR